MNFTILQWNINGYINNYHELQLIIHDKYPDVICLQETHFSFNETNIIVPSGYSGYFTNLSVNKTSKQGIGILVKKKIPHNNIHINTTIATLCIEINIDFNFIILNSYIPPQQAFSYVNLKSIIRNIRLPFILIGDFNSWSPLWGSKVNNERGKLLEDFIICEDLIVLNDGSPTHFSTHRSLTNVDISLCSAVFAPKFTWNISENLHGSDHFPIFISLLSSLRYDKVKPQRKFKTDLANWQSFQNHCEAFCKLSVISVNVNQESARITKCIRAAANIAIPQTKSVYIKAKLHWWNSELNQLRDDKQRLWHDFKRNRSNTNFIAYKKANAIFKKASKESKHSSLEKLTLNITPNSSPKQIWSDIKMLSGNNSFESIKYLKKGSEILTSNLEIANTFASHWSEYSDNKNFDSEFINQKHQILQQTCNVNNISSNAKKIETHISYVELEHALYGARGKTPGFDRISYPMIKNCPENAKLRLLGLYNNILDKGIYPQSWRTAIIIPISKPNKCKSDIDGYRPISLMSCLSKTFEKLIAKRLMWFIRSKNLLSHNQVAFKQKQSTTDILLHIQHYVSNALSAKNHVTILATDFEKAFDRIGAHIVLQQLSIWGVGPKVFNIVKAFLTHRQFRVKINTVFSKNFPLHNGIPQGSPLSVVLFIISFQQLSALLIKYRKIEHSIYADDAIIFSKVTDMNMVKSMFLNILNDIKAWGKTSGARLSIQKCKLLHICKKKNCTKFSLSYENIEINFVNQIKILGITFEKNFTFKQQCINLRKSLTARLNIIKYLTSKHCRIHINILIQVVRSLILSKIEYALPVFGWCAISNLKLLYKPYHTSVRRCMGAFPTSATNNILAEAGLPTIQEHVETTTYKLIHKLFNSYNAIIYKDVLTTTKHKRNYKKISTIRRCVAIAKTFPFELRPHLLKPSTEPPTNLHDNLFIRDLEKHAKEKTNPDIYKQLFLETQQKMKLQNWNFIFTDGSKTDCSTSFAVVQCNGTVIKQGLLENHCSVFSAEATAILEAIHFVKSNKGKYVICSDSRSSIEAIKNLRNWDNTIVEIRNICIKQPNKIRLMWVPGHAGISGNEFADIAANEAHITPNFHIYTSFHKDTFNFIKKEIQEQKNMKWNAYNHRYKDLNPFCKKVQFPTDCSSTKSRIIVRLRLGHTQITHEHLLNRSCPTCPLCNTNIISVDHILNDCPQLQTNRTLIFGRNVPSTLLKNLDLENIDKFINFLDKCNILNKI